jgi:aldehyde dehydrogenase (NAD+)
MDNGSIRSAARCGKSPNIILESADIAGSVQRGIQGLMFNSGQSCSGPSRMIVPQSKMDEVIAAAKGALDAITVGAPSDNLYTGPVVNINQWNRIQSLIQSGLDEGATLVGGGVGRPTGSARATTSSPPSWPTSPPTWSSPGRRYSGPC